ncbi:MAG: dual specificity protein phosphatase family protein [Anaerolineae bacterium]|nr:dual specificity protein phosphatase family protein [Anaerolineae bacterium]
MYHQTSRTFSVQNVLRILKFTIVIPLYRLVRQGPVATAVWAFVRGRLALTGISTQRFSKITPTLYVGGQIRQEGWRRLQAAGVTSIVNMRREHDDRAAGIDVAPEHYLHLPTIDDEPVDLADLKRGADWIADQIAGGGVVYVHCAAGSGRAPSMGAAYLIAHEGMTTDQALATIRARRPFILPLPAQVARLREFETFTRRE